MLVLKTKYLILLLSFSQSLYIMENIETDAMLLRQNVVTSSGRTVIRPTRLDL